MKVTYWDRAQWGADKQHPRRGSLVAATERRALVQHHSVGGKLVSESFAAAVDYVQWLQTGVAARLGADVPYSFVPSLVYTQNELQLLVCEGRGWFRSGAHTVDTIDDGDPLEHENRSAFGCGWQGDWRESRKRLEPYGDADVITDDAVRSLGSWLRSQADVLIPEHRIEYVYGHRDFKNTSCPSDALYARLDVLRAGFNQEDDNMADPRISDEMVSALTDLVRGVNEFNADNPNDSTSFLGIGRTVTKTIRHHTRGHGTGWDHPATPATVALDKALADHSKHGTTSGVQLGDTVKLSKP